VSGKDLESATLGVQLAGHRTVRTVALALALALAVALALGREPSCEVEVAAV
jgi:hypothetical protein